MTRSPLAVIVFAAGALASVLWAVYKLLPLRDLFGLGDVGSGGIGGFTTELDALRFLVAPLITFAIAHFVRERTGVAETLRRAHIAATFVILGVMMLFVLVTAIGQFTHGVDGIWYALLTCAFIGGALWLPLQGFFTAGFIGLLINERRLGA
jgi:hypothetical protein